MSIKITRQKRPDRVICKWKSYVVVSGDNSVCIIGDSYMNYFNMPKSEIPNLIKALLEVSKETK